MTNNRDMGPLDFHDWSDPDQLAKDILRLQDEFTHVASRFREENIQNSIVFFGSARIHNEREAKEAQEKWAKVCHIDDPDNPDCPAMLKQTARDAYVAKFYTYAEELAFKLTEWSLKIPDPAKHFLICSGGGPGIMEASNKGAHRAGGRSIGLAIEIPYEQASNRFISPELQFSFNSFLFRKFWFFFFVKAMVVFPGGLGTMDELFEILTLIKTGKIAFKLPIVLFGEKFWRSAINFDTLVEHGTVRQEELDIITYSDSVDETFDYITKTLEAEYLKK